MHVTERLRELRLRAGLSMGAAAKALGLKGPSSYQRYENADLFKDELLPLDIAKKLAIAFAATGKVSKEETLALCGLTDAINDVALGSDGAVPLSIVETAVRAFAEFRQEDGVSVTPDEEGEMVSKFCSWYFTEAAAGRKPKTMSAEDAKSLFRLLSVGRSQ